MYCPPLQLYVPFNRQYEYVKEFKQAHRRDDDIAIVNACVRLAMEARGGGWVVGEAAIAYGGVAPLTIMAPKVRRGAVVAGGVGGMVVVLHLGVVLWRRCDVWCMARMLGPHAWEVGRCSPASAGTSRPSLTRPG